MSLIDKLTHDGALEALLVVAVTWLVVARVVHLYLLRFTSASRSAELFRVAGSRWALSFFAVLLVQKTLGRIDDHCDLGHIGGGAFLIAIVVLRVAGGVFVWMEINGVLDVVKNEFLERELRAYGRVKQRNTATLLYGLARPLGLIAGVAFVFSQFHLDVASYLVTLGGISIAFAFALQRLLTNMFAGLSLAIDAPFSQHDLIRVGVEKESKLYEVMERGVRVTTVRDITNHEIVYVPNALLAEQPLAEVTRPTDDVRVQIDVAVANDEKLRVVRRVLLDIALGHPHLVGPFDKKQPAIKHKLARLLLRGELEDCLQHWVELGRLRAEDDLNKTILNLKTTLEHQAGLVDQWEDHGFDAVEQQELAGFAKELARQREELGTQTTVWLMMVRNALARGRFIPTGVVTPADELHMHPSARRYRSLMRDLDKHESESVEDWFTAYASTAGPDDDKAKMAALSRFLEERPWEGSYEDDGQRDVDDLDDAGLNEQVRHHIYALRVVNAFAKRLNISPQRSGSDGAADPAYLDDGPWGVVKAHYAAIGDAFVMAIVEIVTALVKGSPEDGGQPVLSIVECRSRSEDLYVSENMVGAFLDQKRCRALLGAIADDDERADLAELFRVWADKTHEVLRRLKEIEREFRHPRSTTIDTQLRDLASSLKMDFKDPFPLWKQPIASMEGFGESSVNLALKVYVDNVRMDKYMRMYSTLTNVRLRIVERLLNEGIALPSPRYEVTLFDEAGNSNGSANDSRAAHLRSLVGKPALPSD
jgi:small-conductance mechanosensitive channel